MTDPSTQPIEDAKSLEATGPRGPERSRSFARIAYRQLVRNRLAMVGFAMIVFVAAVAAFVPLLANDKPYVIRTTLPNDYEQAYYSCLDALEQLVGLMPPTEEKRKEIRRNCKVLAGNVHRMKRQLDAETGAELSELLDQVELCEKPSPDGAPVEAAQVSRFEIAYAPETVELVPRAYFPLLRSLRPYEVFFMFLFLTAVVQWFLRHRSPPSWGRVGKALVAAAIVSIAWSIVAPLRVYPVGYFKRRFEEASFVLMPPVPYGETESVLTERSLPPSWTAAADPDTRFHLLGTDTLGRDVFSRMIYGSRIAMAVGFVAVSIYVTIGVIVGALAGFFRGKVDMIVSRIIEIVICFPTLFLILTVLAFLRPSIINIMVVIGLTGWTGVARLTRGEFFRIVNLDYVSAVQCLGGSSFRIIFRHVLPNGIGPVLVVASFGIAAAILIESALSFLGLGVPQPHASWGTLLNDGRADIWNTWWLTVFPGVAIFITVTAWNLFGEGLRDAIDPRLKQ